MIIFDVGNVIIKADQSITHRILESCGVPKDRAMTFYKNDDYREFSRGHLTGREFYNALIKTHLSTYLTYEQVVNAHNEHIYDIDSNVVKILSRFPKSDLAILTDTNQWQLERELQLIDLSNYSDRIFRSHQIHFLKIDEGCFPYVISQLGVEPSETLLVDDSIEKVEMAQKYDLQTYQFKDANRLGEFLKTKNLLS